MTGSGHLWHSPSHGDLAVEVCGAGSLSNLPPAPALAYAPYPVLCLPGAVYLFIFSTICCCAVTSGRFTRAFAKTALSVRVPQCFGALPDRLSSRLASDGGFTQVVWTSWKRPGAI